MPATSATYEEVDCNAPTREEILVALSFALDLTEGAVPGHAIRSCLLAVRIGLASGLDAKVISNLYYACLLKDVGCSSNSARMCQIVGGDDRVVKAGAKLADWTRPFRPKLSTVKLLWEQVLPGASFLEKGARLLKLTADQHKNNRELIDLRCDRGATIVQKLGLGREAAIGVRHLDEHWDGGGYPAGLKGSDIPVISRLMGIAQHLDVFCMDQGPQARSIRWWSARAAGSIPISLRRRSRSTRRADFFNPACRMIPSTKPGLRFFACIKRAGQQRIMRAFLRWTSILFARLSPTSWMRSPHLPIAIQSE